MAGANIVTLGRARSTTSTARRPRPSPPRRKNDVGILGVWPGARALNVPLPPEALTCSASARGVRAASAQTQR